MKKEKNGKGGKGGKKRGGKITKQTFFETGEDFGYSYIVGEKRREGLEKVVIIPHPSYIIGCSIFFFF